LLVFLLDSFLKVDLKSPRANSGLASTFYYSAIMSMLPPFRVAFALLVKPKALGFLMLIGQFVLGGLMFLAGAQKLVTRRGFERTLRYTFEVPRSLSVPLAVGLPIAECGLGVALLVLVQMRITPLITGLMLLVFTGKLMQLRLNGLRSLDCGCFGSDQEEHPIANLILRNCFLIALATTVFLMPPNSAFWPRESRLVYVGLAATTTITFLVAATLIGRGFVLFRGLGQDGRSPE
jgi:hypothetical protein